LLGVSNRAYVVRADIDLDTLNATSDAPAALAANGTYWFDTQTTTFGLFEWNNALATTTGGQTFASKVPTVITDETKLVGNSVNGDPKASFGALGDYCVVATNSENKLFYKNRDGIWVQVGTEDWLNSWPVITATVGSTTVGTFTINGSTVTTTTGMSATTLAQAITTASIPGVTAEVRNSKVEIFVAASAESDGSNADGGITIAGTLTGTGITAGTYFGPALQMSKHTSIPLYKRKDIANGRPTGSVWIKTTEPNNGARFRVKRFNSGTSLWEAVESPIYNSAADAIYNLDRTGGGLNIATGTLFTKTNNNELSGQDSTPAVVDFTIYRRSATGATTLTSAVIATQYDSATTYTFSMAESLVGGVIDAAKTITLTSVLTGGAGDADFIAGAINSAGFAHIVADVDAQNRLVITHTAGGEIQIDDGTNTPLSIIYSTTTTTNLFTAPTGLTGYNFVGSLWAPLTYTAGNDAPTSLTDDGALWYSSVVDEIDIMIHDGDTWVGYNNYDFGDGVGLTDAAGPLVAASMPETQSDGVSALVTGDLWIDTNDLENFPTIYKYNDDAIAVAGFNSRKWVLVDKTDQSSEDGVLFADARYNTAGSNSDEAGLITDLLESDYLDPDAPDPALYPKGMLLWNLRRSGFNVKKFVRNYIDTSGDNERFNSSEAMADYYPHRWVTESGNQEDGSGTFGRKAQRKVVVQALQALVNSNQQIRDEDGRIFNLIACPGYPELIGEMISLNYDRGLTAFVVGDTPARLTPDATSLLAWGNNANGALEDNDVGAASFDEYMGMFYPWGYTSDNFGNNVAVPPSHMILRTIALNDQVAYPWFAPAGVRRGGITNATAVGYISSEGEFKSVALNGGQRDTLYETKVNPITFFTGTGLVNYGQKTRARAASALDRINVARLVIHLRRQLNLLAKPYIFEPNDKITRDEIKGAVEALLLELVGQRALYDYLVVCDESNNTPSRIDRNELWIDIAIEPVKAVEFIYIPLRLKNTGEIAGL